MIALREEFNKMQINVYYRFTSWEMFETFELSFYENLPLLHDNFLCEVFNIAKIFNKYVKSILKMFSSVIQLRDFINDLFYLYCPSASVIKY